VEVARERSGLSTTREKTEMIPRRPFVIVVAAVAMLGTVSGCGSDDSKVQGVVADYLDAVGEENYAEACKLLHDDARKKLSGDCAQKLKERYGNLSGADRESLDDIDVRTATVNGSTATVAAGDIRVEEKTTRRVKGKKKTSTSYSSAPDVTNGAGFTLKKSGDEWKISAGV
jgi:type IV pilus biogenesis protein CpaD/CtpE